MKKLWFKAKHYGWGWYPCSKEGWLAFFLYLFLLFQSFETIDGNSHSISDTLIAMVIPFLSLTILLIIICFLSGEKPHWRWGNK